MQELGFFLSNWASRLAETVAAGMIRGRTLNTVADGWATMAGYAEVVGIFSGLAPDW